MENVEILKKLINKPFEENWFEFKENYLSANEIGEYISAISNACLLEGENEGYLVWGIDNKTHNVVGTNFNYNIEINNEPLQHYLSRLLYPSISFKFDDVTLDGKHLVLLTIDRAKNGLVSFDKQRYFRIGSSKVLLSKYPDWEAKLWQCITLGTPNMINTISPIQTLEFNQLKSYYLSHGLEFNELNFKQNLHLMNNDGLYNMLGCILSDNGGVAYTVSVFNSLEKEEQSLFSTKSFINKSILYVIDEIIQFSASLNIPQSKENLITGFREDLYLFNQECFNEAVKNAFIHNNWLRRVAPQITFYNDRVEILSFSKLAPTQTIDGFYQGNSIPVNEDLSIVFLQTHLSERSGKGVPTIVKKYGKNIFEFKENSIKVTIPYTRKRIDLVQKANDIQPEYIEEPIFVALRKTIIIDYLKTHKRATICSIAKDTKINKTAVQKIMKELKYRGIIYRVGSDKTGYWKLNPSFSNGNK